jgi:hypothetical protein
MSEHDDDRYAKNDLPRTTAEFRAAPDLSASTAEFKAFASKQDRDDDQRAGRLGRPARPGSDGVWPEQPWAGEMPNRGSGRTIAIIGVIVAVLVIIILIIALG